MKTKCPVCGKEFEKSKTCRAYCSVECRKAAARQRSRKQYGTLQETKKNTAVEEVAKQAREAGMTYGQYVAEQFKTEHAMQKRVPKNLQIRENIGVPADLPSRQQETTSGQQEEKGKMQQGIKRIYISGPITGTKDYMERFAKAEGFLKEQGYDTINPAKVNAALPDGTKYEDYMQMSIAMLNIADTVYMMEGWQKSRGAALEHDYAAVMGKQMIYEEDMEHAGKR